ncbi:hypothetical protein NADFUDRAFT_81674 [Nadsonia fulvescens var. elongata DSM 6958]|uniref:1,3-beta-glucanosyltransferase n=1 Tax=Nadsonia fulvescens var. elongata DSM 6958 TaxID=857566 RepID=A0A1E3PNQ0_9ASCO|nr:hypothetical protein NADFUDRAFT_81674 [Nadsonia fulvescens var. elongata DSM 6958]
MKFSSSSLLAVSATATAVAAVSLPAIEVVGNKFYYSNNGTQFYLKGIAYQADTAVAGSGQSFVDPLGDIDTCKRDLPYLKSLNTNTLRVYAINTTLDHDDCMNLFAENDIYVIADLSQPSESINRDDPTWSVELYKRYTDVVDAMHGYTNVLGFFAGNEVTNNNTNTDASPFVKAAVRDMKSYIKEKDYRAIPVGYSTNDDADTRVQMADYFNCGDDADRVDFYGINMYEWCGSSTFEKSGYADRTDEFKNLTVPVFFSEYGCNEVRPRQFSEVAALYSDDMTDVWSGGIVYMYYEEANNYGLVSISDNKVQTLSDFNNLSKAMATISPSIRASSDASIPSGTFQCPASTQSDWKASPSLPPTPNDDLCACMTQSLGCIVAADVDEDDYADLFSWVCDQVSCDGINADGAKGTYGAYAFCSSAEKLSYVLNLYYLSQKSSSSACDSDGKAQIVNKPSAPAGCSSALSQAGSVGTGNVVAAVTGISRSTTLGGSISGGSAVAKTTTSKSSAGSSAAAGESAAASTSGKKNSAGVVTVAGGLVAAVAAFAALI